MEEQEPKLAPFILKPLRINNYTHLIALLKMKQAKYSKYVHGPVSTAFSKILGKSRETFNLEAVLDGFLHEKLQESAVEFEKKLLGDFERGVNSKIKELKVENDQAAYASRIGNLRDVELLLLQRPSVLTFKDELLFDLYTFINQRGDPLRFLQDSYQKYVVKFVMQNCESAQFLHASATLDDASLKKAVKQFARLRFHGVEYRIEIYEGRALWAEAYVMLRLGRHDLLLELLTEHEMFFEFMGQKFKTVLTGYLAGRKSCFVLAHTNEDLFKKFLFELANEQAKSDGVVINTAEDYIWLKQITREDLRGDIDRFENPRIRFMVAVFAQKYAKAIAILLKSDINVIAKFFLLRELCLEQNLCGVENVTNVFDMSNRAAPTTIRTRSNHEDSSSAASLASVAEVPCTTINPIFMNFLFSIVSRLSTPELKVRMIEMLKHHHEYYDIVPPYIIKYELFEILGQTPDRDLIVGFTLDNKMSAKVLQRLRESGDRRMLMKLHRIIDDVSMVQILREAVEEALLVDEVVDQTIVEKYTMHKISRDSDNLCDVYGLYRFNCEPSVVMLRKTVLFDHNADLKPYRFLVEKVFPKAVDIVKHEGDRLMARHLFNLCGVLGLNEECVNKATRDLVYLV